MARHPLPREQGRPTHAADRSGDAGMGEARAFLRESINVRCFDNRMPCTTESIMPPVIGVEHHHIQRFGFSRK